MLKRALMAMATLYLMVAIPLAGQTPDPEEPPGTEQTEGAAQETSSDSEEQQSSDEISTEESEQAAKNETPGPCEVQSPAEEPWLDQFRREVFESVCESAEWFDGFFGSRRFDQEARRTHGRFGVQTLYDEHEGFELDGTMKVRVDFPNLENRFNAFLGREQTESFLAGSEERLDFLPDFFESEGDEEWLVGLGYRPVGNDRSSLDFDVGIEIETPVDPFVSARYRRFWLVGQNSLFRASQTVYWTNQRDLGTSTRADYERPFGRRTLGRVAGGVVYDELTDGVDWDAGVTLYHGFSPDRAVSWYAGIDGETGRDVPIEDYGTRVTYRQRMLRPWFFGEIITGVTWPRDTLEQERDLAWHFGVGFEIFFSGEDLGIGRQRRPPQTGD